MDACSSISTGMDLRIRLMHTMLSLPQRSVNTLSVYRCQEVWIERTMTSSLRIVAVKAIATIFTNSVSNNSMLATIMAPPFGDVSDS